MMKHKSASPHLGHSFKRILAVLVTAASASCSKSVAPPVAVAATPVQVSFADLFGIEAARTKAALPSDLEHCLEMAHEDFNLALNAKPLRHAQLEPAAPADGGGSFWRGPCYSMVVYRQITHICAGTQVVSGLIVGPELRLAPNNAFPERAAISHTRFIPFEEKSTIEPAIACDTKRDF
jgi:hypothetical protein